MSNTIDFTRINNDINGNPRYVCHYLNFITDKDEFTSIGERYNLALTRAKKLGGKKFHNKQYGGGIVFQSYNNDTLEKDIKELMIKVYLNHATFRVLDTTFYVSAKLINSGVQFPFDPKSSYCHNEFKITIDTPKGTARMKFYGSEHDYKNNKVDMDESDLKHSLYCFVSDACSAKESFENFCSELGYDTDSMSANRIYKACQAQLKKFEHIAPDVDIYDIVNALND